jgi:hypothetical protein
MSIRLGPAHQQRTWKVLLTLTGDQDGPLPFRHAPHLATGDLSYLPVPMSSILYPAGLRQGLLKSFGITDRLTSAGSEADGDDSATEAFRTLAADLRAFGSLEPARQAQVLAALNCLTEQDTVLALAPQAADEKDGEAHGLHVAYEIARATARKHSEAGSAREAFSALLSQDTDPFIAAHAGIQLGALRIRTDENITAAGDVLAAVNSIRKDIDPSDGEFASRLTHSRYHRLNALLMLKAKEFGKAKESMDAALSAACDLLRKTADDTGYERLVALENYKIVGESHFKAAVGSRDLPAFTKWGKIMLALDPEDHFTWRYLVHYSLRLGLETEALTALAGLISTGGLGINEMIDEIMQSHREGGDNGDFDEHLVHAMLVANRHWGRYSPWDAEEQC